MKKIFEHYESILQPSASAGVLSSSSVSSPMSSVLNSPMWSCHRLHLHYFLFTENSTERGEADKMFFSSFFFNPQAEQSTFMHSLIFWRWQNNCIFSVSALSSDLISWLQIIIFRTSVYDHMKCSKSSDSLTLFNYFQL